EQALVITTLKEELRKLKGKAVVENDVTPPTIAPVVHKVDLEPLSLNLKNNREAHVHYIRITKENADTLCAIVKQARTSNPLDNVLAYALNDRDRAKVVKSMIMKEWKTNGKMFKNVGYKWVPTRRTFTIVGTKYPLTRFTSTKIVPPRKPVKSTVITNIKPSSASQWRPKETNHASSSIAPKIVESRTANHLDPNNHMRSNVSISPCSLNVQCRSYKSYLEDSLSCIPLFNILLSKLELCTSERAYELELEIFAMKLGCSLGRSSQSESYTSTPSAWNSVLVVTVKAPGPKSILSPVSTKIANDRKLEASMEMLVLEIFVDESHEMILDNSLDMIVDESLIVEDKSLVKLVDETLMVENKSLEKLVDEKMMVEDHLRSLWMKQ
nr:hypothetical protein [Tanacetum cinerariifolium]